MELLAASHENHLQKIEDHETQLIEGLKTWKLDLLKEVELSVSCMCDCENISCILHIFFLFLFLQIKDKHVKQHYFRKSCLYACTKDFKDQLEELQ